MANQTTFPTRPMKKSPAEQQVWTVWSMLQYLATQMDNRNNAQPTVTKGLFSAGPPSNPKDGDRWIADTNAGHLWEFQYSSGFQSFDGYGWGFVGGPKWLFPIVDSNVLMNALSDTGVNWGLGWRAYYQNNAGITIPRPGYYQVDGSYTLFNGSAADCGVLCGPLRWDPSPAWNVGNSWNTAFSRAGNWGGVAVEATSQLLSTGNVMFVGLGAGLPGNITVRWQGGGIIPQRVS